MLSYAQYVTLMIPMAHAWSCLPSNIVGFGLKVWNTTQNAQFGTQLKMLRGWTAHTSPYICTCIHSKHTHIHTHAHIHTCTHIFIYICRYTYIYIYTRTHTYTKGSILWPIPLNIFLCDLVITMEMTYFVSYAYGSILWPLLFNIFFWVLFIIWWTQMVSH